MAINIRQNTPERRAWDKHRAEKILMKRTIRLQRNKHIKSNGEGVNCSGVSLLDRLRLQKVQASEELPRKEFLAPNNFSIENNREETLLFFSSIIDYIEKHQDNRDNVVIYIDSSKVISVTESTLMYLFAIISDVKCAEFTIAGNHPENNDMRKLYKNCGFDKILYKESFSYSVYDNGNIILCRGDGAPTDVARDICLFIRNKLRISTYAFYGALIELMTNTVQHAFDEDYRLEKKWQLFARFRDGEVRFVFLDTGKGIPSTVRKTKTEQLKELLKPAFRMIGEGDILQSAFDGNFRTSTEEPNRGKGLPQIYDFMKSEQTKEAAVFSGRGTGIIKRKEYSCYKNEPVFQSWKDDVYGTLYEFTIIGVNENETAININC